MEARSEERRVKVIKEDNLKRYRKRVVKPEASKDATRPVILSYTLFLLYINCSLKMDKNNIL